MAYSIEQFRSINHPNRLIITQHSRKRLSERDIHINEICDSIKTGIIIEDYPNDYPFPSCLILGKSGNKILHICASIHDDYIYIITVYIPDPAYWEKDWKTRKENTK